MFESVSEWVSSEGAAAAKEEVAAFAFLGSRSSTFLRLAAEKFVLLLKQSSRKGLDGPFVAQSCVVAELIGSHWVE